VLHFNKELYLYCTAGIKQGVLGLAICCIPVMLTLYLQSLIGVLSVDIHIHRWVDIDLRLRSTISLTTLSPFLEGNSELTLDHCLGVIGHAFNAWVQIITMDHHTSIGCVKGCVGATGMTRMLIHDTRGSYFMSFEL
jgi:hypothetical protein